MVLKAPIEVRAVWHPDDVAVGAETPVSLPDQLFTILQADPTLPAGEHLHVPVSFHTGRRDESGRWALPVDVPFERAEHVVVVALVGDTLIDDDAWSDWFNDLRRAVDAHDDEHVQLVGVALTKRANDLDGLWGGRSRERAFEYVDPIERDRFVRIVVLRTLARQLRGGEKVGVFVSHAKADGAVHAEALIATLRKLKAAGFLDIEQIEGGQDFAKVLRDGLAPHTVMVAIISDQYSRRVWCRWEALRAKQQGLPTVVLDIVTEGQQRSVPYLGNTPVVRCNVPSDASKRAEHANSAAAHVAYLRTIEAGTTELVRSLVFPRQVAVQTERLRLLPGKWLPLATPPELLSLMVHRNDLLTSGGGVYPDPPVPVVEADLLSMAADPARLTTRMRLAAELAGAAPDHQLRVGVSISRSDEASVHRHAQGSLHLDALFMQLCLHLLATGHVLAYGGDPLQQFTQALRDLDRAHSLNSVDEPKRLRNYLARYLWEAPAFGRAEFREAMDLINVDRTVDPSEPDVVRPVLDLTAMRQRMTAEIDVRVALGGDPEPGPPGTRRAPGVIEELYLALRAGVPVLVAGGFGGASEIIAHALQGELDDATVNALDAHFAPIEPMLAETGAPHTFRQMLAAFGPDSDLRNKLTAEENSELLTTEDIDTAVALILTSVHRLAVSDS